MLSRNLTIVLTCPCNVHFQSNNSLQYTELCLFSNISFPETSEFDTSDTFISRTVVTSLSPASSNLRDLATLLHPKDTPSRTSDRRSEQSQAWCPWGLGSYPPLHLPNLLLSPVPWDFFLSPKIQKVPLI